MRNINLILISAFLFLAACDGGSSNTSQSELPVTTDKAAVPSSVANTGSGGGGGRQEDQTLTTQQVSLDQTSENQTQPAVTERKIIRNADIKLETNSPEESQQKITQIAESKNGFVIETSQTSSDARTSTRDVVNMTIRVPAAKFDESINEIRASGSRVIEENIKGQDVTEEFIDIEARLKAQRALEGQFIEIMKRATTVEDALNVQRELAEVRGEIEKVEGRKRFLENQSSLSTIKIQLQTPTSLSANPSGFFYELKEALSTGFNAALKFVLFFVTAAIAFAPFFIFIILPLYLLWRYFRKNRTVKTTPPKIFNEDSKGE
ncbi:MAG: DUF4349 domain-containing protein [Pyrinomonadaceae bacterium]